MKINRKKSVVNILFFCSSFLCLIRFVIVASIHAYGFIFFGLTFLLFALNYRYKIKYSIVMYIPFILVLASMFFAISNNVSENNLPYYITLFSFPFIYYCSTILLISQIGTTLIIQNIRKLILIYIVYLFVEIITRILLAIQTIQSGNILLTFRVFKNSIAYSDTNFLGLHILNIFCLTLFLRSYTNDTLWRKYSIILFFLAMFTLSRSVIITSITILYLIHLYYFLKRKRYILILVEFLVIILLSYNLYSYFLNNDGSFRSKLEILDGMENIYNYSLNNILCGFGFGKGEYAYSYVKGGYGHLHIAMIVGQYGILGVLLFLIFFIYLFFLTNGKCFFLIAAFFISGFSLMFLDSSLFWCLGIISVLSKRNVLEIQA
jgi:hypothetical protein